MFSLIHFSTARISCQEAKGIQNPPPLSNHTWKIKMVKQLLKILIEKNYVVYQKPFQLNIIGVRSNSTTANSFDDRLLVIFQNEKGVWEKYAYTITTDPGTYWLKNPLQVDGAAILQQGQYVNAYQLGLHRGQYRALVQRKPVTIIRDYDRNATLDFNNGKVSTGLYGINIHRASVYGITKNVAKWSAGCQVFQKNTEYIHFMSLCEKNRNLHGNQFTYSLIDFRAIERMGKRYTLYTMASISTIIVGIIAAIKYIGNRKQINNSN